jgi:hypothetical protein
VHLADSANFKAVTSNKLCNGLTGLYFESPNDTIHVNVVQHAEKANAQIGTFGFCRHAKPTLKNQKSLNFCQRSTETE